MRYQDTPLLNGDDDAPGDRFEIREVRVFPDVSGNERLYGRLIDAVSTMTAGGPDADEIYHRTLRDAEGDEEFAVLVLKTLDALEEASYLERWALVQLAIDLENPVTAGQLSDLVLRPVPDEQAEDTAHGLSTVTEEVILRTTAIEGLARLFSKEVDSTGTLLETIASSEYVAMQRAAWFALADNVGDDALERARGILEERGFGWISALRRTPVQDAQQADPRLIDPDRDHGEGVPAPFNE